jgi:spermidine synthase
VQPWRTLDEAVTSDGALALRQRGTRDFLLTIEGRVLMSSMLHRSEDALARLALERLTDRPHPRVLTAGLGLGFTLRALLDAVGRGAEIEVAELHEPIVRWCLGPLAAINGGAASDPRVRVRLGDVMRFVEEAARVPSRRYDAIVLDLMEGPSRGRARANARLYGPRALASVRAALRPGGIYAVWGEEPDPSFVEHLQRAGFDARKVVVGGGGPKHVVYVAQPGRGRELERPASASDGPKRRG